MRNSKKVSGLVAVMAVAAVPASAWGYGIEIPENGAVAFGRGGAFMTRASDPSAVMHNVAGIMALSGFQLTLSSNVGSFQNCFTRSGNYQRGGEGAGNVAGTVFESPPGSSDAPYVSGRVPYPQECKDPSVALAPMLLGTYRINRWIAIGFGVFAPSTQGSAQHYADRVTARDPMTGMSFMAPSPARNLLYQKDLLVLHPVIAVAVQPTRWLRFGLGLEPSFANFRFGLNANADLSAPQSPSSDVFIHLDASGFFMAGSVSTQILATRFLSFGLNFHYNGPIDASGTGTGMVGLYALPPAPGGPPSTASRTFQINSMRVQLPWTFRAGVRYNMPRTGRPTQDDGTGTYDPMTDDVFDIEAVFNYEATSLLSETALSNSGRIPIDTVGGAVDAPAEISIKSALQDTYGVRIGGDWNVIPGRLAVRLGGSYETAGVSGSLAQIHLPAYAGGSVHAGLSFRWRWLTISAGYGHFFFQDNDASTPPNAGQRAITVPPPPRDAMRFPATAAGETAWQAELARQGLTSQGQIDPATGCGGANAATRGTQACTINRGVYSASFDAATIGFTAHW